MKFHIEVTFEVTDKDAASLNAELLGMRTPPAMSGGFSTHIEADTPAQALADAFAMAERFERD
jgi:hypothetical protein